jgi:hypothetical protein
MIVSTLTGLVVEAVKKILVEHNVAYQANTLAGIVSAILSAAIGIGYIVFSGTEFTAKIIVCIIAMVFMSWLCSMVGYDKVVGMLKTTKKD